MKKVILDTNFLMIPYTEKVDIFQEILRLVKEEHILSTLSGVIRELKKIRDNRKSKGRDKIAAKIALQLIEEKNMEVIESQGRVDESIIRIAQAKEDRENTIVCTNDKELRKALTGLGIEIVGMRNKNHLDFV